MEEFCEEIEVLYTNLRISKMKITISKYRNNIGLNADDKTKNQGGIVCRHKIFRQIGKLQEVYQNDGKDKKKKRNKRKSADIKTNPGHLHP